MILNENCFQKFGYGRPLASACIRAEYRNHFFFIFFYNDTHYPAGRKMKASCNIIYDSPIASRSREMCGDYNIGTSHGHAQRTSVSENITVSRSTITSSRKGLIPSAYLHYQSRVHCVDTIRPSFRTVKKSLQWKYDLLAQLSASGPLCSVNPLTYRRCVRAVWCARNSAAMANRTLQE